jgi:hypothetical protein
MKVDKLKSIAKELIDDGTNTEYVRGICELIADIDGREDVAHAERSIEIAQEIGMSEYAARNLYNTKEPDLLNVLVQAKELMITLGSMIRSLDVDSVYSEFWTQDGGYVNQPEFKQIEELINRLNSEVRGNS